MRIEDEVEKMRKEIVELEQLLEIQRLQNMAWWETSDQYQEELEASEEVREEYAERAFTGVVCDIGSD